jgi:arylsulfatase A
MKRLSSMKLITSLPSNMEAGQQQIIWPSPALNAIGAKDQTSHQSILKGTKSSDCSIPGETSGINTSDSAGMSSRALLRSVAQLSRCWTSIPRNNKPFAQSSRDRALSSCVTFTKWPTLSLANQGTNLAIWPFFLSLKAKALKHMRNLLNAFWKAWLALVFVCSCADFSEAAEARKPNILIIMADDLGYGDLGCYGHPAIRTPNLDRMAVEGMRFTSFYSGAPVCTPSRAALLTGRLAVRSGLANEQRRVLFPYSLGGLPANEVTMAQLLKTNGYATACIGKWHLGHLPQFLPRQHGFDYFFGLPYSNDMDELPDAPPGASGSLEPKNEWWNVPLIRNEEIIEQPAKQSTLTRRYTEEAIKFVEANTDHPFLLYFPHTFPHVPLFASETFQKKSERGLFGDVIQELDWSVGEVLETLKKQGLAENTFVFFTSDNGPWLSQKLAGGSAGPLREGKGSTWEGGMRVPGIAWWPGKIKPDQVSSAIACNMDLFTTSLRLAGIEPPKGRVIDGKDLSPVLFGSGKPDRDFFFYHRDTELFAIRKGPWKIHLFTQSGYGPDAAEKHEPPLLYNLETDPGEKFNIANQRPDIIAQLLRLAEEHKKTIVPVEDQTALGKPPTRNKRGSTRPEGTILLRAREVTIHGDTVRYEPQWYKNTVGYWTNARDWISWDFDVAKPGKYAVVILQGCGPGSGGSDVEFSAANQIITMQVQETKGFQDFRERNIGTFDIPAAGHYTLTVKPKVKPGPAVMDLRQVELVPQEK